MTGVYGHDSDAFLGLEPSEVAAAIWPEVRRAWDASHQIHPWNLINAARTQFGSEVAARVSDGWQWLENEGFVTRHTEHHDDVWALSAAGERADLPRHVADARALGLLRAAELDPELAAQVLPIFFRGQYDIAVLVAMRLVEDRVRFAAGLTVSDIGVALMRKALSATSGPLTDPGLDGGEKVGQMELFSGAIGVFKNPPSHRLVDFNDPQEAAEAVLLANSLLRLLTRAMSATRGRGRPRVRGTARRAPGR